MSSHPTIGSVGLSEPDARKKYGDKVKVYTTSVRTSSPSSHLCDDTDQQFKAMSFAMLDEDHKQPTKYKLVVVGEEEKVVGLHIIGEGSDEIMQGCECIIQSTL
jgi:glutathione reductase (NADPH)